MSIGGVGVVVSPWHIFDDHASPGIYLPEQSFVRRVRFSLRTSGIPTSEAVEVFSCVFLGGNGDLYAVAHVVEHRRDQAGLHEVPR
jgi:hypothetical protein